MKKISILLLFLCFLLTANAGYVKRGITTWIASSDIKNYTLTFDSRGEPIAAGSMYSSLVGVPNSGLNSIVIARANTNRAQIFPIVLGTETKPEDYHIEVKDFHYERATNSYVLCGVRGQQAFVARINFNFTTIEFADIHDASYLYSIWGNFEGAPTPLYYACGPGVILQIDPITLMPVGSRLFPDRPWIFHKIIGKWGTTLNPNGWTLIASGMNPDSLLAGFAMFDPQFTSLYNYYWRQPIDNFSLCVVTDDIINRNHIILATSIPDNGVGLHHIDILQLQGTTYTFLRGGRRRYVVQDIASNREGVSVAGFYFMPNIKAWYGHLPSPTGLDIMDNNEYDGPAVGDYEHYKVRYDNTGKVYTGGYFSSFANRGVLFASPQERSDCDSIFMDRSEKKEIILDRFELSEVRRTVNYYFRFDARELTMPFEEICRDFTEEEMYPAPVISENQESIIEIYYDRITVKNIPDNTAYQIYSTTGQLVQKGTSTSDISITNLNKGMYFLRLENGEVHKFVK